MSQDPENDPIDNVVEVNFRIVNALRYVVRQYTNATLFYPTSSNLLVRNFGEIFIELENEEDRPGFDLEKIIVPVKNPMVGYYKKMDRAVFRREYEHYRQLASGLVVSEKVARQVGEGMAHLYEPPHFLRVRNIISP